MKWVMDHCFEWDAPVVDALRHFRGDWYAILEIVRALICRPLLDMSLDEILREDVAPHSIFTSSISHFLYLL